jgi:hypothetical protein
MVVWPVSPRPALCTRVGPAVTINGLAGGQFRVVRRMGQLTLV